MLDRRASRLDNYLDIDGRQKRNGSIWRREVYKKLMKKIRPASKNFKVDGEIEKKKKLKIETEKSEITIKSPWREHY